MALQLNIHKKENEQFRAERNKFLKNFRKIISQNNLNIISKIKNERKSIYNEYILNEQKKFNEKKNLIQNINKKRILSQENKKKNEYQKKIKLKKELIKKIKEENETRKNFEIGVNKCQNKSIEILERIRDINNSIYSLI